MSWFALAARDMTLSPGRVLPSVVQLEACESYAKQSYRNRCYILSGDGVHPNYNGLKLLENEIRTHTVERQITFTFKKRQ